MNKLSVLLVSALIGLLVLASITTPVSAMTGSGTEGDPYMIYDADDLQDMNLDLDAYYKLANDINATGYVGFVPIGPSFAGTLDGDMYSIYDLSIISADDDDVGLFSSAVGATVEDLYLWYCSVWGADKVGGLIGDAYGCTIQNAWSSLGSVTGDYKVGGLVGQLAYSEIVDSGVGGSNVTGYWYVGGLAGVNSHSTVQGAYVGSSKITGYASVGGLNGVAENGNVARAYLEDIEVSGSNTVGGLIGSTNGYSISTCEVTSGSVYGIYSEFGTAGIGGFIGTADLSTPLHDCYTRADVIAASSQYVGGFVGSLGADSLSYWENAYSTGSVDGAMNIGGFCGYKGASSTIAACFWDVETSGMETSDGGTGKTTLQMTTQSTFTSADWDFDSIWYMDAGTNDGYPFFWLRSVFPDDFVQVVWFQPDAIIEGTELPNRMEEEDGIIHWGTNPDGVSVVLSPFYSDYAPANITLPEDIITPPQDMIGPTGNPGMTRDIGTLATNPFYPLVKAFSDNTGIPVQLWWIILASLIVLIVMVVTYWKLPHLMITALAGGGLSAFFYAMGIYPFWVPLIFAVMALAIIIGERSPTV